MFLVRITVGLPRCLPNQAPLRKPEQGFVRDSQLSKTMRSLQNTYVYIEMNHLQVREGTIFAEYFFFFSTFTILSSIVGPISAVESLGGE